MSMQILIPFIVALGILTGIGLVCCKKTKGARYTLWLVAGLVLIWFILALTFPSGGGVDLINRM